MTKNWVKTDSCFVEPLEVKPKERRVRWIDERASEQGTSDSEDEEKCWLERGLQLELVSCTFEAESNGVGVVQAQERGEIQAQEGEGDEAESRLKEETTDWWQKALEARKGFDGARQQIFGEDGNIESLFEACQEATQKLESCKSRLGGLQKQKVRSWLEAVDVVYDSCVAKQLEVCWSKRDESEWQPKDPDARDQAKQPYWDECERVETQIGVAEAKPKSGAATLKPWRPPAAQ